MTLSESSSAIIPMLSKITTWLTMPPNPPTNALHRRRIRGFLALFFLITLVSGFLALIRQATGKAFGITEFGLVMATIIYGLNRQRYSEARLTLTIIISVVFPLVVYWLFPDHFVPLVGLNSALVGILCAAFLLDTRTTLTVATLSTIINGILFYQFYADDPLTALTWGIVLLTTATTIIVMMHVFNDDITRLTLHADGVDTKQTQYEKLLDAMPQAMLIMSENRLLYANQTARHMIHLPPDADLSDLLYSDLISLSDSINLTRDNNDKNLTVRYETILTTHDDQRINVDVIETSINYNDKLATLTTLKRLHHRHGEQTQHAAPPLQSADEPMTLIQRYQQEIAAMAELIDSYTYILDVEADGTLSVVSIAGFLRDILKGQSLTNITLSEWNKHVHPDDLSALTARWNDVLQGTSNTVEFRLIAADGTVHWIQDTARPVLHDGQVVRVYGISHDITERVQAEELLKANVIQQAVVAELGMLAMSSSYESEDALFQHTIVLCEQVLNVQIANIALYNADDAACQIQYTSHPQLEALHFPATAETSLVGYVLQVQESVIVSDMATETRFAPLPNIENLHVASGAAVPIFGMGSVYGVLAVYTNRVHAFTADDVYFLQSIANMLGIAVERHNALEAEREEREFADALYQITRAINNQVELDDVLQRTMDALEQVVIGSSISSVMLQEYGAKDNSYHFEILSVRGYPKSVTDDMKQWIITLEEFPLLQVMIDTQAPLLIDDVTQDSRWNSEFIPEIRSYLGAPIIIEKDCVGFINLQSDIVNNFTEKDKQRLQAFANNVGNAILNAWRADHLEALVESRTRELKQEREQVQAILGSTGEGIFYTEGREIQFANQAFCDMTGYSLLELIGEPSSILQYIPDESPTPQRLSSVIQAVRPGTIWREEAKIKRKDNSLFDAGLTISFVGYTDDQQLRAVTIVRDISQEKQLDAMKKQFIGHAAHELRNPIMTLNTRMYLMEKKPEAYQQHLSQLKAIVSRMNQLVESLLDMSTYETGRVSLKMSNIILQEVIHSVVEIQRVEAQHGDVTIVEDMPDNPVLIWADALRLDQVFTNLVSNAIRYTPSDGTITVCVDVREAYTQIEVSDTGKGIPQEHLEHLFEPFYRVEEQRDDTGTGLGLSITKQIIEGHHGTISVSSEVGMGTTFTIVLPIVSM